MTPDLSDAVYCVYCPSCGWFGMREDCRRGECPNCGLRVKKEKEGSGETVQG